MNYSMIEVMKVAQGLPDEDRRVLRVADLELVEVGLRNGGIRRGSIASHLIRLARSRRGEVNNEHTD